MNAFRAPRIWRDDGYGWELTRMNLAESVRPIGRNFICAFCYACDLQRGSFIG